MLETATDYSNLGIIVSKMGDLNKALQYHNKSLELRLHTGDMKRVIRDYENTAEILEFTGDIKKAREYKEKAQNLQLAMAQVDTHVHD